MDRNGIIKGFPISQNGQDFILGKLTIADILKITRYTERVIIDFDDDGRPVYNEQVQRKVESQRVNKIADFLINDPEATFPTNIVLNVPISVISEQSYDQNAGTIEIILDEIVSEQIEFAKRDEKNADVYVSIIDGQHRIRGIEVAIERLKDEINRTGDSTKKKRLNDLMNIELAVSYFVDKSLEYQAMIFSTINRTQKRVSQDLVYSLFGLSSNDTPYKTALEVVLALNGHPKSPFYRRIKLYGGNYKRKNVNGDIFSPPLSQSTMIKNIVLLICENKREAENDKYRNRKDLLKRSTTKNLPFREFYAQNKDYLISDCLFYFYGSVQKILGNYWNYSENTSPQNILQSTVGFEALLRVLSDILTYNNIKEYTTTVFDIYISKLSDIRFDDQVLFPITTKGRLIVYDAMKSKIFNCENKTT